MIRRRSIVLFVVLALAFFISALLLVPRGAYAPSFRAAANSMFSVIPSDLTVELSPTTEASTRNDTRLNVGLSGRYPGGVSFEARRHGFVPTALLVSLILATPVAWRRRAVALASGLALIHLFLVFRLWITALLGFAVVRLDGRPLLPLSSGWIDTVALLDRVLSDDLHITFVAPVLVWLLVTVRADDLRPPAEGRVSGLGSYLG